MSSLEEKHLDINNSKDKFSIVSKEKKALHSLKNDNSIVIKGADKGSRVIECDRINCLKKTA